MLDILATETEAKGARMEDAAIALTTDGTSTSNHERRE